MKKFLLSFLLLFFIANTSCATIYQIGDGKTSLTVKKNDTIEVVLSENPSTGYIWMMSVSNPTDNVVLKEIKKTFYMPKTKMVGVSGYMHYKVKACEKGVAKIQGINTRPWEQQEEANAVFDLKVTVK